MSPTLLELLLTAIDAVDESSFFMPLIAHRGCRFEPSVYAVRAFDTL